MILGQNNFHNFLLLMIISLCSGCVKTDSVVGGNLDVFIEEIQYMELESGSYEQRPLVKIKTKIHNKSAGNVSVHLPNDIDNNLLLLSHKSGLFYKIHYNGVSTKALNEVENKERGLSYVDPNYIIEANKSLEINYILYYHEIRKSIRKLSVEMGFDSLIKPKEYFDEIMGDDYEVLFKHNNRYLKCIK